MINDLTLFAVSFLSIFLRGHQTQFIIAGAYVGAFVNSWLMAVASVATIALVSESGMSSLLPVGLGSSLGIVCSMFIFRLMKRRSVKIEK